MFLDVGYVFSENKFCYYYGLVYFDLNLAKEDCAHDSRCCGVLDYSCNNESFSLCEMETIVDVASQDCVYIKTGNSYS